MRASTAARRSRRVAYLSTSVIALMTGVQATAQSQSYNAPDPTVTSGNVTINRGTSAETYTINSPTAVLDFVPSDTSAGTTAINFQNANSSVLYTGAAAFTVLNRIVPASGRAVAFNGTVTSRVGATPGGSVWFYSPGGIVLGGTSVFDVGNLLLSARDPLNGGTTIGSTTSFTGGGTGEAGVFVNPGAQVSAITQGSYIALVAPQVRVDGNIRVNGNAVLVAGESATVTFNAGNVDISLGTGTNANAGTPLLILGSITGPASTGVNDPHSIIALAIPKNVIVTTLISGTGNIGFDVASSATITNGRVILTGGYTGVATSAAASNGVSSISSFNNGPVGDVIVNGGRFTSDVSVYAYRNAYAANLSGTAQFDGNLFMSARTNASIGARQNGVTMRVGGNVTLVNGVFGTAFGQGATTYAYTDNGGILDIAGNLRLDAGAIGATTGSQTQMPASTGGNAQIYTLGGGSLTVRGTTTVNADANTNGTTSVGAMVTGGTARIGANGGDIFLIGPATVSANAVATTSASTTTRAVATGGMATVSTATGTGIGRVVASITLAVSATALGDYSTVSGGLNGNAIGGTAGVYANGGNLSVASLLSIDATGTAASNIANVGSALGSVPGNGTGGTAQLVTAAGTATVGSLTVRADGRGGTSRGGGNGVGGIGIGGNAQLGASGGTTAITGAANFYADGYGGDKTDGQSGGGGGGTGGGATLRANGGVITVGGSAGIFARGIGGSSAGSGVVGNGGVGNGGGARADVLTTGGSIAIAGQLSVDSSGSGGNASVSPNTVGGAGIGGTSTQQEGYVLGAYVVSQSGSITANGMVVGSNGFGGSGASGGAGTGGLANIVAQSGTVTSPGSILVQARGGGGNAIGGTTFGGGAGGAGLGGYVYVTAEASTSGFGRLQLGATNLASDAYGGVGAAGVGSVAAGAGGNATGGTVYTRAYASSQGLSETSLTATTAATGGAGGAGGTSAGGTGGNGTAGAIFLGTVSNPDLPPNTGFATYGNASLNSQGIGGNGGAGLSGATGGRGGTGTGGLGEILARGTPVTIGTLTILSQGFGGNGGSSGSAATIGIGGNGVGGAATLIASNRFQRTERGLLTVGATLVTNLGGSGAGSTRGSSTGGTGLVQVSSADATFSSFAYLGTAQNSTTVAPPVSPAFTLDVADGTLTTPGLLSVNSIGDAVFSVRDGGTLSAATLNAIIAGNVLPRQATVPTGTRGTIATSGDSTWRVTGNLALASNLTAGGAITMNAATLAVADLTAGGAVTLTASDIATGNIVSQANVQLGSASVNTGNVTQKIVTGTITAPRANIFASSAGTISTGALSAGDAISLFAGTGISVAGPAVAGTLANSAQGALPTDGGLYLYAVNGPITTGDLTGQAVEVETGPDTDADNRGPFSAATPIRVGAVTAKSINITGTGTITTGALTVNTLYPRLPLGRDTAPNVIVGAIGDVATGNVAGTGFGLLASRDGSVATGSLTFTGSVAVLAGQNATVGQVSTGRGVNDLFFAGNSSTISDPLVKDYFNAFLDTDVSDYFAVPFSPALLLRVDPGAMAGTLAIGSLSTGTLRAGAQTIRTGAVDASQRVQLFATGLADFRGTVAAPLIDISSGDLDIATDAAIGTAATSVINLTARAGTVILGGDGSGTGYRLSNAEAGRLTAAQINLLATTPATTTITPKDVTAPPTILVRELTLNGSLAQRPNVTGTAASFAVRGPGLIRVEGPLTLNNAAATDQLTLSAGNRLEVATDVGGAIALRGAQANTLGGILALSAPVIAVARDATLTRLAADPRYSGRDAEVGTPGRTARPEGYLEANRIVLTGSNVIAVQNSGTAATAGGFTAGTGGLSVVNNGTANSTQPLDVRIYGRSQRADGSFAVNGDTLAAIGRSDGATAFATGSSLNGCAFATATCASAATPTNVLEITPALEALIANATDGDPVQAASLPAIRIVRLLDEAAINVDPIVLDPVAGGGNASLWDTGDEDEKDDDDENRKSDRRKSAPADRSPRS